MSRGGSPCFGVIERSTGKRYLAQRKPLDDELERDIQMHNVLRASPDLAQLHQVLEDNGEAVLVYENADRSFLDSLLPPPSAVRRSPSNKSPLCASPQPETREEQVQVFVKQLLTALQYMHSRGIAHLDLRPEVILLQDDHLRLADFGQSRRLINGKLQGGTIKSNPEFVCPEVVAGAIVTLAADMWSVGALTYVLLTGHSPFLGDNDDETLQNVLKGEYRMEGAAVEQLSAQAKDFLQQLLVKEPNRRLDVDQALYHDWLSDPSLGDTKLSTDCLREFKYHHKWLERRVFVQQTASDQLTQLVQAPKATLCSGSVQQQQSGQRPMAAEPTRAEPFAVYDYLRIKEESKPEGTRRDVPMPVRDGASRNVSVPFPAGAHPPLPQQRQLPGPHSPHPHHQQQQQKGPPRYPTEAPPVPDWIVKQLPPGVKPEHLCWDPYGGGFYLPQQFQPADRGQLSPHGGQTPPPPLPPRSRSGSGERHQSPGSAASAGLAPLPAGIAKKIEAMAAAAAQKERQPTTAEQQQNGAGAVASLEELKELAKQIGIEGLKLEDLKNPHSTLMKLVRGERRQIQDELANRVLSDISEESSLVESTLTSGDKKQFSSSKVPAEEDASTTTTAEHEGPSSSTATPLASPAFTAESPQQFFPDESAPPEVLDEGEHTFSSRHLPLNIPLFLEQPPFPNGSVLDPPEVEIAARGVKSVVQLSPRSEHTMSVQIGIGHGKRNGIGAETEQKEQQREYEHEATPKAEDISGKVADKPATTANGETSDEKRMTYRPAPDTEFELLMDAAERAKEQQKQRANGAEKPARFPPPPDVDEELAKYRPPQSIGCREFDLEVQRNKMHPDDFAWESNYQIGPDTLLVPTIGARFNARVRDYRREIWGDSASYVLSGVLGERNTDVTVRERRRFTDLMRDEPAVAKSVDTVAEDLLQTHQGALRRVQGADDFVGSDGQGQNGQIRGVDVNGGERPRNGEAAGQRTNGDKKFPPLFRHRIKDGFFCDGAANVVFECQPVGNPTPEVTFFHHESAICEDGRHQITRQGNTWRLAILKPIVGVDTGEYSAVAENELGRDKCVCKCVCGEPLGPPSRPDVELSADTEVFVTWEPPEKLPVTLEGVVYRLECRPAGEKDAFAAWTTVSNNIEDEAAIVKHLMPMGIYQFRVTAKNEFGWGSPSIHSRIIRTHPRGIPKLNLDVLRKEGRRFAVVTMPQKSDRKGKGLTEIQEELAEREEDEPENGEELDEKESSKEGSQCEEGSGNGTKKVQLNTTEDPLTRFQLESELFRGQFSVIRYAIDSKSGTHCTVKIRASPSHGSLMFASPAERIKAAQLEYDALAECQHENVVQLIAAFSSDNAFLLLFTERLHENLFQRFIRLDTYTEDQISFIIRQIASAIRWIHFKGFVHGDIEPTNLMFTSKRSWWVKLVDFGRARQLGSKEGVQGDGQPLAEWTAPEILVARAGPRKNGDANGSGGSSANSTKSSQQQPQLANTQTDMWGLGLVTFCLLAGFHPFADDDDSEQDIRQNVVEHRCDPNLIPVQASEEALRFVTWSLKKDPSRRMRPDEALNHRWLATDGAIVRRRENIKYASHRLLRTAERRLRHQSHFARNGNGNSGGVHGISPMAMSPRNGHGSPRRSPDGRSPERNGGQNGQNGAAAGREPFGNRLGPPPTGPVGNGGRPIQQNGHQAQQQQRRRRMVSAEC